MWVEWVEIVDIIKIIIKYIECEYIVYIIDIKVNVVERRYVAGWNNFKIYYLKCESPL